MVRHTHTHIIIKPSLTCPMTDPVWAWRRLLTPPLSLQLAVDAQVPPCFGGLGGQVVYIDTEDSFLVQRVGDLAAAAVRHCSLLAGDEEQRVAMETFTVESILSNVFLVTIPLYSSHVTACDHCG